MLFIDATDHLWPSVPEGDPCVTKLSPQLPAFFSFFLFLPVIWRNADQMIA
jgi:hypothetical protein